MSYSDDRCTATYMQWPLPTKGIPQSSSQRPLSTGNPQSAEEENHMRLAQSKRPRKRHGGRTNRKEQEVFSQADRSFEHQPKDLAFIQIV